MSKIGSNARGYPSTERREQVKFETGILFLDEFYKLIWQYGILKLSNETGIGINTIRNWVQGYGIPHFMKVQQILDHLGYELLIFEKDEPFEQEE